jgi:GNAT superfamily N-acetyltransferase
MTEADIPLGMRLKQQAGWNQLEKDWQRFLSLERDGCFVAELDDAPVGTVTTCVFESVAWIAMMLVDESHRGRGIGKALMQHALDFLDRLGVTTSRLDATSLGQPLYQKLGFISEYHLSRHEGILPHGPEAAQVIRVGPEHLPDLLALDLAVTAADREKLLRHLYEDHAEEMRVVLEEDGVGGYITARPGARAWQIGPCIASPKFGPLLVADAVHRHGGQLAHIDIPHGNRPANQLAQSWGLTAQRDFVRMSRGPMIPDLVDSIWASSGPEMG